MGNCGSSTPKRDQREVRSQQQQQPDTRSNHSIPTVSTVRSDYHRSQTVSFSSAPIGTAPVSVIVVGAAAPTLPPGGPASLQSAMLELNEALLDDANNGNEGAPPSLDIRRSPSSSSNSSRSSSRSSSKSGLARAQCMEQDEEAAAAAANSTTTPNDTDNNNNDSGILPGAVVEDDFPDIPTVISVGGTETGSGHSTLSGHSDYQDGLSDDDGDQETRYKGVPVVKANAGGFMLNEEMMMGFDQ